LLAVFLGLAGIQLILMGLLAEMMIRTYFEAQAKPVYLIKEIISSNEDVRREIIRLNHQKGVLLV
jgi:hypothetical protein